MSAATYLLLALEAKGQRGPEFAAVTFALGDTLPRCGLRSVDYHHAYAMSGASLDEVWGWLAGLGIPRERIIVGPRLDVRTRTLRHARSHARVVGP